MQVTPDATHRIILTKEIRAALNLEPGQSLEVSIATGAVLLTPVPASKGKLIRKRGLKVFAGDIPDVNVEDAVQKCRQHSRL